MSFRNDRVRLVSFFNMPGMSRQAFESQMAESFVAFGEIPVVKKNVLKFELTLANSDFDTNLQSLGIPKSALNVMCILESESIEKINEFLQEPAFKKMFKDAQDGGFYNPSTSYAFSGDVMTTIEK